ncbi:MAG: DUF58 domain-containing protein, partial [Anaerolineae bacterium]|nr:DUF58 domain-containing protein [Anaerolineae bacterium]
LPVAWLWNRLALWGVRYRRILSERRAFVGETITLTVQVDNRKPLPISWLKVTDQIPLEVELQEGTARPSHNPLYANLNLLFSLRWFERVRQTYHLTCRRRGFYRLGPAVLQSGDLFGLFASRWREPEGDLLIVYPRVRDLGAWGLPPKEFLGDIRTDLQIFEDPVRTMGVRDYHPRDGFRRIHWKATARRQALQSRVYEPSTSHKVLLAVNVATFPRHWQGVDEELLEEVISVAASIAHYAASRRQPVGVIANGSWPRADQPIKVLPGRSPAQLTYVLEALAAVTPFATAPLEDLLAQESPRLPWGATVVVVTGTLTPEMVATLARLKESGRRVVLVSLAQDPPPREELVGIPWYHLPRGRPPHDLPPSPRPGEPVATLAEVR